MATVAPACRAALTQANALWPNRSRASDGLLGDAAHRLRRSDHNDGNAFDLTHDPAHGCDAHTLVRSLAERRDPRVKYLISNRRIWSTERSREGWRPYYGVNGHTKHAHVSIYTTSRNDTSQWWTRGANKEEEDDELNQEQSNMLGYIFSKIGPLFVTIETAQREIMERLDAIEKKLG